MLTAGGRALPFGDLANCATAAGADANTGIQRSKFLRRFVAVRGLDLNVALNPRTLCEAMSGGSNPPTL